VAITLDAIIGLFSHANQSLSITLICRRKKAKNHTKASKTAVIQVSCGCKTFLMA